VLTVPTLDHAMAAYNSMPVMNATPAQNDSITMNHAGQAMNMDAFDHDLGGFDEALMYVYAPLPPHPLPLALPCDHVSAASCPPYRHQQLTQR
jgi:hypothetical protein